MSEQLAYDEKAQASITFGDVIRQTAYNYPDSRFHPKVYEQTTHYTIAGINPSPFSFWATADGIGTKPELAERLYQDSIKSGLPDPTVFEGLAFDTLAMIEGDEARFGRYMIGAANILDTNNTEDKLVVNALAEGLKNACNEGRFALLNGETAELGYRMSGYGDTRLNWNAVGISVFSPDKLLLGRDLQPGQPVVAFREKSIRSNGLRMARAILETDFLLKQGFHSKEEYIEAQFALHGVVFNSKNIGNVLSEVFGHNALEQILTPWHTIQPDVTQQLLEPSQLYGPLMYAANGRIDEPRNVQMIAASHITGGGIPEKTRRMVESKGLGVALDAAFPDPEGVTSLLKIAEGFPQDIKDTLKINERTASEQWNRGIGFLVVAKDSEEAKKLVDIADRTNYESAIAGEVIDKPEIQWRNNIWGYNVKK